MINNFIWKKIKALEKEFDVIIRYEEIRIEKGVCKYNYYVYTKYGHLEFKACSFEDLKETLYLYYS